MKKSDIIKLLILIIAVSLNVKTMKSMHANQAEINPDRAKISGKPVASFHKFWADVKWMMFIQHMGSIDLTTESNSKDLYQEAKDILDLDPGFYKVYELSALMLSAKTPDLAIDLLKRGQETHQNKNDWRLYSMAGNIRHQETFFNKKVNKREKLREAIGFYRLALKKPGVMPVLEKTYIKTRAQEAHEANNDVPLVIAELLEWDKYVNTKMAGSEYGMEGEGGDMFLSLEENTKKDILSLIQRVKREHQNNLAGKKTSKAMLASLFKGIHTCNSCYNEYGAGHKFCTDCSKPVKVYGICPNSQCRKTHSNGKFCEHCGTNVKPKKKKK
ncbi:MAG: zinc ribbon domain-containing protein [Lentisphaeraceae bacterium]|nr:zinc ribbon domain-containing protein [Lentisphaeraceae bacterium]